MDQSNTPVTPSVAACMIQLMGEMEERRREIEAALAYSGGTHNYDDVVIAVIQGRLFWMALPQNTFMLTEIIEFPREKHYHVFLAGGNLTEIYRAHERLVIAARLAGCQKVTLGGRRGWIKALAKLGWREYHTSAALDLEPEQPNERAIWRQQDAEDRHGS